MPMLVIAQLLSAVLLGAVETTPRAAAPALTAATTDGTAAPPEALPPLPRRAGPIGIRFEGAPGGGPRLTEVLPGSAAERAGVVAGDRIASVDGRTILAPSELVGALADATAGTSVLLGIDRDGRGRFELAVERPPGIESIEGSEVRYGSVTVPRGYRLRTITSLPLDSPRMVGGRMPAFMFVQGIACDSIDRPLSPEVVDTLLVHAMARAGFVTMRVDKPGIGESEGPPCSEIGFAEELDGFAAALAALSEMPEVDPERIYLFGHSMGGVMVPYLAAGVPVRGSVVYGTLARTWFEYQLENVRRQAELHGYGPEFVTAAVQAEAKSSSVILVDKGTLGDVWTRWPELRQPDQGIMLGEQHMSTRHMRFFHELQDLNIAEAWLLSSGAVLAIWGEFDWVCSKEDHDRIAALVNRRSAGAGRSMVLPGADHAFTRHGSLAMSAMLLGRGAWVSDLPEVVIGWIDEVEARGDTASDAPEWTGPSDTVP
jgi:pimeloyl-ACP methyl ester carboxylesterase